jgi:hypothetical protein
MKSTSFHFSENTFDSIPIPMHRLLKRDVSRVGIVGWQ